LRHSIILFLSPPVIREPKGLLGDDGNLGDAAKATSLVVAGHVDVAAVTPASAPAVLDDPGVAGVADSEDGVVEVLLARAVEDTRAVALEGRASLEGNRDGAAVQSASETGIRVGNTTSATSACRLGAARLAGTLTSSVRIASLRAETTVAGSPVNSLGGPATVAALVAHGARAVNQLLLREIGETLARDGVGALNGTSGREGPARTALTLVLDGSDGTTTPVNIVGNGARVQVLSNRHNRDVVQIELHEVGSLELFPSEIRELVHSESVGVVLRVVLVNVLDFLLEDGQALEHFSNLILLVVLLGELHELVLSLEVRDSPGGHGDQSNDEELHPVS
jgi:hypothetical protein